MKQQVVIHLGHGKTGSSSIQDFLAANSEYLKNNRIAYPNTGEQFQKNVGNFNGASKQWFSESVLPSLEKQTEDTIVYSSEIAFNRTHCFFDEYPNHEKNYQFKLVVFARDPLPVISSTYLQRFKNYREDPGFHAFLEEREYKLASLKKLAIIIKNAKKYNVNLQVINYSECKSVVNTFIYDVLGCQPIDNQGELGNTWNIRSNKSTRYEQYLIWKILKRIYELEKAQKVYRSLNKVPQIFEMGNEIEFKPDPTILEKLKKINQPLLEQVNNYLDKCGEKRLSWSNSSNKNIVTEDLFEQVCKVLN